MNKQQVIALKGEPFRVAAMDGLEYFIYRGFDRELFKPNGFMVYEAFIRFKDGKVDAYGRLDDFDSTRHKELLIKKILIKVEFQLLKKQKFRIINCQKILQTMKIKQTKR